MPVFMNHPAVGRQYVRQNLLWICLQAPFPSTDLMTINADYKGPQNLQLRVLEFEWKKKSGSIKVSIFTKYGTEKDVNFVITSVDSGPRQFASIPLPLLSSSRSTVLTTNP
jgi:hypothetical protein